MDGAEDTGRYREIQGDAGRYSERWEEGVLTLWTVTVRDRVRVRAWVRVRGSARPVDGAPNPNPPPSPSP